MISRVHGVALLVDTWTGETFQPKPSETFLGYFRIPSIRCTALRPDWIGCYETPSTALAGLTELLNKHTEESRKKEEEEKDKDLVDYLVQMLQASLVATDATTEPPVISACGDIKKLKRWGGSMDFEEWGEEWGRKAQLNKFTQDKSLVTGSFSIMTDTNGVPLFDVNSGRPMTTPLKKPEPLTWHAKILRTDTQIGDHKTESIILIPKGLRPALREIRKYFKNVVNEDGCGSGETPDTLTFYFSHDKTDLMAICGERVLETDENFNREAVLSLKFPTKIYGDVVVLDKNPDAPGMTEREHQKARKRKAKAEEKKALRKKAKESMEAQTPKRKTQNGEAKAPKKKKAKKEESEEPMVPAMDQPLGPTDQPLGPTDQPLGPMDMTIPLVDPLGPPTPFSLSTFMMP